MSKNETNAAPFSYDGLDRVIHEKARLGLMASLMAHPKGLAFADLKQLCGLTDGNLSRHLQVLQEAGLVEVTKGYEGNRPHTSCCKSRGQGSCRVGPAWHPAGLIAHPLFCRRLCDAKQSRCEIRPRAPACRHHHGRQWPLGNPARAVAAARP